MARIGAKDDFSLATAAKISPVLIWIHCIGRLWFRGLVLIVLTGFGFCHLEESAFVW
jgi:hypothetical protein